MHQGWPRPLLLASLLFSATASAQPPPPDRLASTLKRLRAGDVLERNAACAELIDAARQGLDVAEALGDLAREEIAGTSDSMERAGCVCEAARELNTRAEEQLGAQSGKLLADKLLRLLVVPTARAVANPATRTHAVWVLDQCDLIRALDRSIRISDRTRRTQIEVAASSIIVALRQLVAEARKAPADRQRSQVEMQLAPLASDVAALLLARPQPTAELLSLTRALAPLTASDLLQRNAPGTEKLLLEVSGRTAPPPQGWRLWIAREEPRSLCAAVPLGSAGSVVLERPWYDEACWMLRVLDPKQRERKAIELSQQTPLSSFSLTGSAPPSSRVLVSTRYRLLVLDAAALRLTPEVQPPPCGPGSDSQSGALDVQFFDGKVARGLNGEGGRFEIDFGAHPPTAAPCPDGSRE